MAWSPSAIRRGGNCALGLRVDLRPLACLSTLCAAIAISALGHKRTFRSTIVMSALPPEADIRAQMQNVRFVPIADIAPFIRSPRRQAAETTRVPRGQAPWPFED